MKIDINGVSITLTKEQLKEIDKKVKNIKTLDHLNSYKDACDILGQLIQTKNDFEDVQDWNYHQLRIIIKAANFIDNNMNVWKIDWLNSNEYKYYSYWIFSSGGWSFDGSYGRSSSTAVVGYYKNKSTCELISKRFDNLYKLILNS